MITHRIRDTICELLGEHPSPQPWPWVNKEETECFNMSHRTFWSVPLFYGCCAMKDWPQRIDLRNCTWGLIQLVYFATKKTNLSRTCFECQYSASFQEAIMNRNDFLLVCGQESLKTNNEGVSCNGLSRILRRIILKVQFTNSIYIFFYDWVSKLVYAHLD